MISGYTKAVHQSFPVSFLGDSNNPPGGWSLTLRNPTEIIYFESFHALLRFLDPCRKSYMSANRYFNHKASDSAASADTAIEEHLCLLKPIPSPIPIPTHKVGIDLNTHHLDVRKILYSHFFSRIKKSGYDFNDVLQTVYQGIIVRNNGKCPFDKQKSSFGHYVFMVCECILNNYHRKGRKILANEILAPEDQEDSFLDTASISPSINSKRGRESAATNNQIITEILPSHLSAYTSLMGDLALGYTRKEILERHKLTLTQYKKIINEIQEEYNLDQKAANRGL